MVTAEVLQRAIEFSVEAHKGQVRKGDGRPYIVHPMNVMNLVSSVKKKSKNLFLIGTAAVLHDTVEDCENVTIQDIADNFGLQVASIVEELTLDKSKYETMGKKEYLAEHMCLISSYSLTIKLCDRLDNVRDMENMNENFRSKYIDETNYILEILMANRTLTKTQKRLMDLIEEELRKYGQT